MLHPPSSVKSTAFFSLLNIITERNGKYPCTHVLPASLNIITGGFVFIGLMGPDNVIVLLVPIV